MPGSPLTIQAWFQAPAQYSFSPQRAQGGKRGVGGGTRSKTWGGGVRECVARDLCVCVCVSALCLLFEVLERDMVLSVEREDVISLLQ